MSETKKRYTTVHELKTTYQYWKDVYNELKTFEVRKNDRDF